MISYSLRNHRTSQNIRQASHGLQKILMPDLISEKKSKYLKEKTTEKYAKCRRRKCCKSRRQKIHQNVCNSVESSRRRTPTELENNKQHTQVQGNGVTSTIISSALSQIELCFVFALYGILLSLIIIFAVFCFFLSLTAIIAFLSSF